jgi:hypothetical protein
METETAGRKTSGSWQITGLIAVIAVVDTEGNDKFMVLKACGMLIRRLMGTYPAEKKCLCI